MINVTDDEIKTNVAANLQRLLRLHNMTGLKLSQLCGESQPTISNLLRGQYVPKVGTLSRVAAALGTSIDYLVSPPVEPVIRKSQEFVETA